MSKPTWSNTKGVFHHVGFFRFLYRPAGVGGEAMTYHNGDKPEKETQLESHLQARLGSRVRHLRVLCRINGIILQRFATTYHAKQLAQHFVMEITNQPVLANEIEVC